MSEASVFGNDDVLASFGKRKRSKSRSQGTSRTMSFPPNRRRSLKKQGSDKRPKVPFERLAVSFDVDYLEFLLCKELAAWGHVVSTGAGGLHRFQGLAQKCQSCNNNKDSSSCTSSLGPYNEHLEHVNDWLCTFLEHPLSRNVPPLLLAQVHTAIGLIRQAACSYDAATRSHLHAAWILSHTSAGEIPFQCEHLSVTLYRLGTLYGRLGKHKQMQATLRKAFDVYAGEPMLTEEQYQHHSMSFGKESPSLFSSCSSSGTSLTFSSFVSSQQLCTVQEEDESDFLTSSKHRHCVGDDSVAATPVFLAEMDNLCL